MLMLMSKQYRELPAGLGGCCSLVATSGVSSLGELSDVDDTEARRPGIVTCNALDTRRQHK